MEKKKKIETNHEIIFHAFISLLGIGELLRANEKPWFKNTSTGSLQRNESMSRAANDSVVTRYSGNREWYFKRVPFFPLLFSFFFPFFFLMLTFPRFHGRVLLEARIAERQSPLGSMWKAWRIYFQLSPFNSTGLLNPRSCVRTVIATDPFFSLTPSLPLIPLRYRRLCFLFVYLLPAIRFPCARFFTVFPFSCQRNFIPGNHGMPFRIAVRH